MRVGDRCGTDALVKGYPKGEDGQLDRVALPDTAIDPELKPPCGCGGARSAEVRLGIAAREYAILAKLRVSPSAIVLADSGNLPKSGYLPFEVFPRIDLASSSEIINATPKELARAGLSEIFRPAPAECVTAIPLSDSTGSTAHLLVKGAPDEVRAAAREICSEAIGNLGACMSQARFVPIEYEWQILSQTARYLSPCLVIDPDHRLVAVNNLLCDMVGRTADQLAGIPAGELIHFERETSSEIPYDPECIEVTTSVLIRPLQLFFTSNVSLTRIPTLCGDRIVQVLQDIYTDRRAGNSNILLVQKLSSLALTEGSPQTVIVRLLNLIALTLRADLVCVLRRKANDEMIVTPYCNRNLDSLHANVVEIMKEPVLAPFFAAGTPIFCDSVEASCPEPSFFREVSSIARFALIPVGDGVDSGYAVLAAWSKADSSVGAEAVPVLRIIANLVGTLLVKIGLITENLQEKENLRRYARLTAGRETRMASMKRDNAHLRELVTKLSERTEE